MSTIHIHLDQPIATISPLLYGHFAEHLGACIYDGIWQDGAICPQLADALRRIKPPVIRWPGGCFADDYHWRDGIGPSRPQRVNIHWGNVVETNAFGTHEFIRFCRDLGALPYISGNVGSGSPSELRDWVEYCNYPGGSTLSQERAANGDPAPFGVRFWGVGNENWGCGGHMTPEDYAREYRRFSTYLRDFADTPLYLIACGPDGNDLDWTRRFFQHLLQNARPYRRLHGFSAHYYCGTAGTATVYSEAEWYELLFKAAQIESLILQQRQLMDTFDPERRISLVIDEWGTWHPPTPGRNPAFLWQQNTLRDALVAAITLDTFNRHADKLAMCNIAQVANVLQALFLIDNGRLILTPTYHVFDLYKNHQGARSLSVSIQTPDVLFPHGGQMRKLPDLAGSASIQGATLTLTVTNSRVGQPTPATIHLAGGGRAAIVRETVLTHADIQAHNTFDNPAILIPSTPRTLNASGATLEYAFVPNSVTRLEMAIV